MRILLVIILSLFVSSTTCLIADPTGIPDLINLLNQPKLGGDCFGYRPVAETNGVVLSLQSTSDLLGNTTGGAATGTTYSGLLDFNLAVDLQKAVGWAGASFKSSWLWLYGSNLSTRYIGNALAVSSIAGYPAFRADELWLQQNFLHDAISLRGGMLALDTEFLISDTASLFVNNTFGPLGLFTMDVPNSGPTYPMGTPGIRLALQPTSWLTFRTALTQANPLAQNVNRSGFDWNFGPQGGLLSLNEAAATWNKETNAKGLPGTAKLGFWLQNSQAENYPGIAPGAYSSGFYGIIDQQLYAVPDKPASPSPSSSSSGKNCVDASKNPQPAASSCACSGKGLSSFARIGFSPQSSSQVSFYSDAGLVDTGLIPTRDADKLGVAFGYAQAGSQVDSAILSNTGYRASYEAVAELSYSAQLTPAIVLQPDLQYILHPGGTQQYGNALVVGMRAVVNF